MKLSLGLMVLATALLTACTPTSRLESGIWLDRLPAGAEREVVNGITYYRHQADYFVRRSGRYVSVQSPRSTLREKRQIGRGMDPTTIPAVTVQ